MLLRFHRNASLRTQVAMLFGAVVVVAAMGGGVVPTALTALGAGMIIRSSIAETVTAMQRATMAIAAGSFGHRIASSRRDELGGLAGSIDEMAAQLQALEEARQRMLASVSHELRTPLTLIRGHAFTLGRGEVDAARRAKFDLIDAEVERLASLIEDLLMASRLRAAPVRLESVAVEAGALVAATVRRFSAEADERGLVLACDAPAEGLTIVVDRRRIDQVVDNLLANALAHAPRGSEVVVAARPHGKAMRVEVTNCGEPLDAATAATIFEPFVQGPRSTGSVGLGLSIARDLVRAHGSDLHVRTSGERTTFWFELPCLEVAAVASRFAPELALEPA